MITRHDYIEHYWNNYLLHEREFIELISFVDICHQNFNTCSAKIIEQYLSVCVDIEAAFKLVADIAGVSAGNYPSYARVLLNDPEFVAKARVRLLRGKDVSDIVPFDNLNPDNAPKWWHNHNEVKHDRAANYTLGTMEVLLYSLSALYYLNLFLAKLIGDSWLKSTGDWRDENTRDVPNDVSKLFQVDCLSTRHAVISFNAYVAINEEIREIFASDSFEETGHLDAK